MGVMLESLFGKRKKKRPPGEGSTAQDETVRSAGVGDVVVIRGFSPSYEDAYFIVELVSRFESRVGRWQELIGVDGDRRVGIEWSDDDGLFISVTEQQEPMGLTSVGLTHEELVRLDNEQSIDNYLVYEGVKYHYVNSYEVNYFRGNGDQGEGFYMWEFTSEDREKMLSVIKSEGAPFEVQTAVVVSPDIVSVYKK